MNITKLTETYINSHPSVKDCVRKGLINYSALTRNIADDLGLDLKKNFDAILIACRRYFSKVNKEIAMEDKIIELLKKSKVEVKNKIIAVIVEKNIYLDNLQPVQQICAELALLHFVREILVRGSNNPDIKLDGFCSPNALYSLFFKNSQQSDL